MKLSDFDYKLPKELIANCHMSPRDHSRLMVMDRNAGKVEHKHFYDILDYLKKGDILVFNNSKVFKARIFGTKQTGGKIEFLLVRPVDDFSWEALIRGRVKVGDRIIFNHDTENNPEVRPTRVPLGRTSGREANTLEAEIIEKKERGCVVRFNKNASEIFRYLEKFGEVPLPPYIKEENCRGVGLPRPKIQGAMNRAPTGFYQTVYAKQTGSVAAPTAGFHFTSALLDKLKKKGVECLEITLHVGPGTFLQVESNDIKKHKMHEEFFEVKKEAWDRIVFAKTVGAHCNVPKKRVIAVGTTTARVLETLAQKFSIFNFQFSMNDPMIQFSKNSKSIIGSTNIFIYPPYNFKVVDCLTTNFHLPKSTLMMLVSAFLDPNGKKGISSLKKLYQEAIKKKYRFYSFGDSMLIK